MIFILVKTESGKRSWLTSKDLAKLLPRIQKLYQITYIFCNTVSSISIQPFDPLGYSVSAEPNYLFAQHVYLAAYFPMMLQAPWYIADNK